MKIILIYIHYKIKIKSNNIMGIGDWGLGLGD